MSAYTLVLFGHVLGAICIFTGLGIWLFSATALRRAVSVEQVRLIAGPTIMCGNLMLGALVLLGAAGIDMALTAWGGSRAPWIVVATVSFLLLAPVGAFVLDPRLRAVVRMARNAPDGPLPEDLALRVRDPVLAAGLQVYLAALCGIVFLMITKPLMVYAVLAMAASFALGLVSAMPLFWRARRRDRSRRTSSSRRAAPSPATHRPRAS